MCHLRVSTLPICMWREERRDERMMGWTDSQTEEEWSLFMLSSILPLLFLLLSFLCQRTLKGLLILPPGFPPASTPLRLPLSLSFLFAFPVLPPEANISEETLNEAQTIHVRTWDYIISTVNLRHHCRLFTSRHMKGGLNRATWSSLLLCQLRW